MDEYIQEYIDNARRQQIGFRLQNEFGEKFYSSSSMIIHEDDFGELTQLGEKFNTFLAQAGYVRDNPYIYMEDLTEEELRAVDDFITNYRNGATVTYTLTAYHTTE